MNFNTIDFVLFLLPVTLLAFHLVPQTLRIPVLILASVVFYGASGLIPLLFLVISAVWAYFIASYLEKIPSNLLLWISVLPPLLILFLFKYFGFFLDTMAADENVRGYFRFVLTVVLPAGISFYTFQIVSYLIDVKQGRIERETSLPTFFAFVSLYCQLIAGPIVRYAQVRDQLHALTTEKLINHDFFRGLKYFSIGLAGKIFVADIIHLFRVNIDRVDVPSFTDATFSILAYSFQIYYDFWAYSLMAIGLGKMIAIDLPVNFREPYQSPSPREFWRRWHVTLSYWLRDYVYLQLGGNQKYVRNILIVFAAVGLWHGAGWNFIVWGLYHALLVIVYHYLRHWWDNWPRILQIALTFTLVTLGWPLFYLDISSYLDLLKVIVVPDRFAAEIFGMKHWLFILSVAIWTFAMRESYWLYNKKFRWIFDSAIVHAVLAFGAIMLFRFGATFIYFRF